jgi:hypothetical protein
MDETYRMLGREHEADLEREAAKWRLGDLAREQREEAGSRLIRTLIGAHRGAPGRTFFMRGLRKGVLAWRGPLLPTQPRSATDKEQT